LEFVFRILLWAFWTENREFSSVDRRKPLAIASLKLHPGIRAVARGESPIDPKAARELLSARRTPNAAATLSARELEVLAMVGEGLPNKLIARRLAISEKTVKAHLTSVYRQIGVTDRTQAALWARRNGVTADES